MFLCIFINVLILFFSLIIIRNFDLNFVKGFTVYIELKEYK